MSTAKKNSALKPLCYAILLSMNFIVTPNFAAEPADTQNTSHRLNKKIRCQNLIGIVVLKKKILRK